MCVKTAAECPDPATLASSTASITSYFDDDDKPPMAGILGVRGTGWFLSPWTMVTAEHVADGMRLSKLSWKRVEIANDKIKQSTAMRILRADGSNEEKLVVLELLAHVAGARSLETRMRPLATDEPVVSLAYPGSQLRLARGRFVQYGEGIKFSGTAFFEIYDGNDRLVLDHGSSGAPVLDCDGRVVAVVSNLFTQTLQFPFRAVRISTAWGQPNVISVPIQVLKDFIPAKE
jgi:hypothetical protein